MAEGHACWVVPFYLLDAMAESDDHDVKLCGSRTLAACHAIHEARQQLFANKLSEALQHGHDALYGAVPNVLLQHLAEADGVDEHIRASAQRSLAMGDGARDQRQQSSISAAFRSHLAGDEPSAVKFTRGVYDMKTQGDPEKPSTFRLLPGQAVRLEGQPATSDKAVNEAYDNCLKVLDFYKEQFNYISLDNRNMPVVSSVHFGKNMGNAFWTSQQEQMVYGDGDGQFLYNFTGTIDVIGHEMTHAVTEYNSKLQYKDESGALNEHISDVFGIMVKQKVENEDAANADWLIGEGCLLPGVKGVSLRNMKDPGSAYNDPRFGKDPQPADYAGVATYKQQNPRQVARDQGGVHIFSGVPNKAFYLASVAFGGYSWEKAGKIWWETVTTNRIPPNCTFIQFADETVGAAERLFGVDAAKTVRDAWNQVGVVRKI